MRHYITPDDLPQNLLFDDFEVRWIYTGLAPSGDVPGVVKTEGS